MGEGGENNGGERNIHSLSVPSITTKQTSQDPERTEEGGKKLERERKVGHDMEMVLGGRGTESSQRGADYGEGYGRNPKGG